MPAVILALALLLMPAQAAPPPAPDPMLARAVEQLGALDFSARTDAARRLRRAPSAVVARVLQQAVQANSDEYVRFRAFVLLTGIDAVAAAATAERVLGDKNDRVRTVAYQWFEHHPVPSVVPRLLAALETELSEFVRPALTRALAAQAADARVQAALRPLVMKGEDMFRGAMIEALGDYGGNFALPEITAVSRLEGPLQDDAITAIGRLGGPSGRETMTRLQATGPAELQPTISSAVCLLGIDCEARIGFLTSSLTFATSNAGHQPLLRSAVHGLAALASAGHVKALEALIDVGVRSEESARAPIALGIGLVAFRQPSLVLEVLSRQAERKASVMLLRDAFDMLAEDFEEERFAATLRQVAGRPAVDSPLRVTAEALLIELEY